MNNDFYTGNYNAGGYSPSYLSMARPQYHAAPNTNIAWTMGIESAKAHPVMPGHTVLLMDSESPRFFIKTVDVNGFAHIKTFVFQEEQQQSAAESPTAHYVTQEQLQAALAEFAAQLQPIENKNKNLL